MSKNYLMQCYSITVNKANEIGLLWHYDRMKELTDSSIESRIIWMLKDKPLPTATVIEKIQKSRPNTPKQSVYLALRKLKKKEVVAMTSKTVSLHQSWIISLRSFLETADANISSKNEELLTLEEKESITYSFNSLLSLDMFWAHAFGTFMSNLKKGESSLLYNPHEWFLIARKNSEYALIKETAKRKINWLGLIGGKTPLDTAMKAYFDGTYARCHFVGKDIFPNNYYMNCFGEFLIEVWLDPGTAQEIEGIYKNYSELNKQAADDLRTIVEKKQYKHRMRISRNNSKAMKMRKLFDKYFLIES